MKPSPYPSTRRCAQPSAPSCADRRTGPAVRWCTGDTELVVTRNDPAPARGAVVVGAPQLDRAQHGVDRAGPVADELGHMTCTAVDPWPTMARIGGQRPAQQRAPEPHHRGAHGQLHRRQVLPGGTQQAHGQRRQPVYLRGELGFDLPAEPPFSSPVAAGGAVAAGFGGRASQIASLTTTICSLTSAKRW
jgi:hypothetical protein